MNRHRFRAATAVLTTALVISGVSAPPGEAGSGSEKAAAAKQSRIIKPAKVGKAKIGMTVAEAMATGQFNQDVPNPPCDPITLQPKKPFKRQYVVFVRDDRIVEIDAGGSRVKTPTGVSKGSTYRRVLRDFGSDLSRPKEVGYGQWGAYVHKGKKGPDRKWLGFLFGEAYVADGPLQRSDTVTLMGVTKGKRPALLLDGC